jgi:hypothetical protein
MTWQWIAKFCFQAPKHKEVPNLKLQHPKNIQASITKPADHARVDLGIGYWSFPGAWMLEFGASLGIGSWILELRECWLATSCPGLYNFKPAHEKGVKRDSLERSI